MEKTFTDKLNDIIGKASNLVEALATENGLPFLKDGSGALYIADGETGDAYAVSVNIAPCDDGGNEDEGLDEGLDEECQCAKAEDGGELVALRADEAKAILGELIKAIIEHERNRDDEWGFQEEHPDSDFWQDEDIELHDEILDDCRKSHDRVEAIIRKATGDGKFFL